MISGVLFQCIHTFVTENQDCFLVMQDKKSSQKEEAKKGESKTTTSKSRASL